MFCSRCGTEVQQKSKFCPSCGLDLSTDTGGGGAPVTSSGPADQADFDVVRDALKVEYELIKELGRGGMATVYRARDKQLDREVAIKVLPFALSFDKDFVERFQREARTAARLEHPHIIPVYRVGESDRVTYFVMKFVRGSSLSDVIKKRGALPPAQIRKVLSETVSALSYAHKNGIVHRDIKPDNIMLDDSDRVVVMDFGIAKAASGAKLTGTGMSIGTPHYMSPEQARAQPLDGRSDIYSLGVVGYQCLTGDVPFDGEDSFSIGYKHVTEEVPTPALNSPEQRDLYEIIRRMMAKVPNDRFDDADHLARVLEGKAAVPDGRPSAGPNIAMRSAPTTMTPARGRAVSASTPTTPMPRSDLFPPEPKPVRKRRSGVLVGMLFVVLAGGGTGGWYYYQTGMRPPSPASPPDSARMAVARPDSSVPAAVVRTDSVVPMTGSLVISGLPVGGQLKVDGKVADAAAPLTVSPGPHRVEATARGFDPYSTTVIVERDSQSKIALDLRKTPPPRTRERPAEARVAAAPPPRAANQPATNPPATNPPTTPNKPPSSAPNCEDPATGVANPGNACFDDRPGNLTPPLVPIGAEIEGNPKASVVWVLVGTDGTVQRVIGRQISDNTRFHVQALNFAKSLTFKPGQKNGQPVTAWIEVPLRPIRR